MTYATGLLLALILSCGLAQARQPTALFYMMKSPASIRSLQKHVDKIGLLVPTWYGVDNHGLVNGGPNMYVLKIARHHQLPVMPIISMTDSRKGFHQFLHDPRAQQHMIDALLQQGKQYRYNGFQFDFENISWTDRDAYTALVKRTAQALHKHGLKLSIAVVPNAPGHAGRGKFSKWMWQYWRGAYDLSALGKYADVICLMTYDQHTRWTTPGPVAGMPWVMRQLKYALKRVPGQKLSLGIPLYGYHWFTGNPVKPDGTEASNIKAEYINARPAELLAKEFGARIRWDPVAHESWFYFYRDQMREWVFTPDARSFHDRYTLTNKYHLEGFCAWVLGAEDPKIWNELPTARH